MKLKRLSGLALLINLIILIACKNNQQPSEIVLPAAYTQTPALKSITDKIIGSPENARNYYERGMLLHGIKQDSLALMDFNQAVKYDSTKAEYFSAIGELLFEHKDLNGSLLWIKKAIELNPNDMKAHLKIAKMFVYLEDYPNAFKEINKVLREDAMSPEAYFLKGMIYKNIADSSNKAMSSFMTAVQIMPEYKDALMQIGLLYDKRNDSTALLYYQNAFKADTTDVTPLYARGMYYQNKNNIEGAKAEYKKCISYQKDFVDAHFNIGYLLLQQDSFSLALNQFDKVTQLTPNNAKAFYNRGLCNELQGKTIEAIADYTKAVSLDNNYQEAKAGIIRLNK